MTNQARGNLFEASTMTFGEHLEELRVSLTRALIGLLIGFLLGLAAAKHVVMWIETPLIAALEKHLSENAKLELQSKYAGKVSQEIKDFVATDRMIFEEVFIERRELARWARESGGASTDPPSGGDEGDASSEAAPPPKGELARIANTELPPPDPHMIKTRIWRSAQARLTTLSPHETFVIWLKAAFVSGLVIASPYMFYEIWVFVAAGLFPHERKWIYVFLPFSLVLFISGAAMAFFFVFGPVLNFLFSFARSMDIAPDLRISEVISFVLFLPLGFGVSFQLPLVMLFLNRINVFTVEAYLEKWRVAILAIFVISMFLTPVDPISMLLMATPLTALYFLGVGLCHWMPKSRNPFADAYEP
ncbi:MAG: twin-arginine translocase subunit TatC [Pirellulaceae bacterium]